MISAGGILSLKAQVMNGAMQYFLQDPCLENAQVGLSVLDLSTGEMLMQHNQLRALPPASTLKLLTTIQALDLLPKDLKIRTTLGYRGQVRNDTLHGDLVIRGNGDPTLGSKYHPSPFEVLLKHWASIVQSQSIKHITGDIIADASYFTKDRWITAWSYEDLGNYYGAVPNALNIRDNEFTVDLEQKAAIGAAVPIHKISPSIPNFELESFVKSGSRGSGDQAYIIGGPLQSNRYITGTIPAGTGYFKIRGSIPDPPAFLAFHLREQLGQSNISIGGADRSSYLYLGALTGLDTIHSLSLDRIVELINQKSINLYAECLGLIMEKIQASVADRSTYWNGKIKGSTGMRLVDYSGLAMDNAIPPQAIIDALSFAYAKPDLFERLLKSLSVGGKSGTLKNLFRDSPARGSIYAKSGLINGVRNYAGYMKSSSGRWLAFCVFTLNPSCNSYVVRKKLEHLLESMYLSAP